MHASALCPARLLGHRRLVRLCPGYFMSPKVYPKITNDGPSSLHRWTKTKDLRAYNRIFFPIHYKEGRHWGLAIVNIRDKKLQYPLPIRYVALHTAPSAAGTAIPIVHFSEPRLHVSCSLRPCRFMI